MSQGIQLPFYQVDAFTDTIFSGNPAAVCVLDAPLATETMQAVADGRMPRTLRLRLTLGFLRFRCGAMVPPSG